LQSPHAPQRDVRQVDSLYPLRKFTGVHEVDKCGSAGFHYCFIVIAVVNGYCGSGKSHECVSSEYFSPGVAADEKFFFFVFEVALLGCVFKAIEEAGAACARSYFGFVHFAQRAGRHFAYSGGEYDGFSFFYRYFECAGHPEVFCVWHSALKVFQVFESFVPVRVVVPFRFAAELHE
jgi:hypothetical protein